MILILAASTGRRVFDLEERQKSDGISGINFVLVFKRKHAAACERLTLGGLPGVSPGNPDHQSKNAKTLGVD